MPKAGYIFCPHCACKNPSTAYCCLHCFKVMSRDKKFSILGFQVPPVISFGVIVFSLAAAAYYISGKWLASVEANMTINVKTAEYNVSVVADKRINQDATQKFQVEKLSSDEE